MKFVCNSISDDVSEFDNDYDLAMIEFDEGLATINDGLYNLSNSVVNIEVVSGQREIYDFLLGDRLNATVYIHNKYGRHQALLAAIGSDGKNYFFELKYFSIIFLLDEDSRLWNEGDKQSGDDISMTFGEAQAENTEPTADTSEVSEKPLADDKEDIKGTGAFILFDEAKNLFFATVY